MKPGNINETAHKKMKPKGFFTTFRVILSVYGYRGSESDRINA